MLQIIITFGWNKPIFEPPKNDMKKHRIDPQPSSNRIGMVQMKGFTLRPVESLTKPSEIDP